jgi:tRNA(Ile)-lysidine synthase
MAVGGLPEPPRLNKLEGLVEALRSDHGRSRTLAGCRIVPEEGRIRLFREPGRNGLPQMYLPAGQSGLWDRRFRVGVSGGTGPLTVRALGRQGFAELRRQQDIMPSMPSDMASGLASFWRDRELIAVPHLGYLPGRWDGDDPTPNCCFAEFVNGPLLGPGFGRRFDAAKPNW